MLFEIMVRIGAVRTGGEITSAISGQELGRAMSWRDLGANLGAPSNRPKSKWGRHHCRPHSYRRVVVLLGEPYKTRLASDVSPLHRNAAGFATGARAGIQHPLASSLHFPEPEFLSVSSAPRAELRPSTCYAFVLKRLIQVSSSHPRSKTKLLAIRWIRFAISSNDPFRFQPKPSTSCLSKFAWTITTASIVSKSL